MRTILLYLILVGLPVAGVMVTLHAGQKLVAPTHVGGTWRLQPSLDPVCGAADFPDTLDLTVSQSGARVEVLLGDERKTRLHGSSRGLSLSATGERGVRLTASETTGGVADSMHAVLAGLPCSSATHTVLVGTRKASPAARSGH